MVPPCNAINWDTASHMETMEQWITQNDLFEQCDHATVTSLHSIHDNDKYIFIAGYTHSFLVLSQF